MTANGKPITVDFYYDFLCPWAYRASEWIREVQEQLGPDKLEVKWRYFPLEQVNSDQDPEWKIWEQPDDFASRGLEMFRGALAAWNQDQGERFETFHQLMFRARHGDHTVNGERPSMREIAAEAGLDLEQFDRDLTDRTLLTRIGEDYEHARERLGVFGVPTLVFENDESAYVKLLPKPPAHEVLDVWDDLYTTIAKRPYIFEVKRPTPPGA